MPPDQKRPLDTYFDSDRGKLASYQLEVSQSIKVLLTWAMYKEEGGALKKHCTLQIVFYAL